jgi:hypothetical protein
MDEETLYSLRRTPPEEFARRLRASLQTQQIPVVPGKARVGKFVALAACCAMVFAVFTVPSVRAAAQAFLDLFRVVHLVGVPVGQQALQRLQNAELDLPHLLGNQVEILKSTVPIPYPTTREAGAAAGIQVRLPAWLPVGWETETPAIKAGAEEAARITIDTARMGQILSSLGIEDESLPESINGQSATVHIPPMVEVKWAHNGQTIDLMQSPSPQVQFPAGTDLAALGEIGLRILGMSRSDAYRFAQTIDWRTTLLVPLPANVVGFSEVNVQGSTGLLIGMVVPKQGRRYGGSLLLWSANDRVFALRGTIAAPELVEMAQTVQ